MHWWRSLGLRHKLVIIIQLTSSVAVMLACAAFMVYTWINVRRVMANDLTILGDVIANNSTAALSFDNATDGREVLQALRARPHIVRADLYDKNGRHFAAFVNEGADPLARVPTPGADGARFEDGSLRIVRPVVLDNKRIGTLLIESDLVPLYEQVRVYGIAALVVLVVSILISYILSAVLQRTISDPIVTLSHTARQITQSKDYSVRAPQLSVDEIGQLAAALNRMLDGIQQSEAALQREIAERRSAEAEVRRHRDHLEELVQERTGALQSANERLKQASLALTRSNAELEQFAYVASHDLREPLRTISSFVQLLRQRLNDKLGADEVRYMHFVTDAVSRMDALINALLQYARLDTRGQPFQSTNCNTVLDMALENLRATIEETGATVTYDHPLPTVHGDPTQLSQLLQNLIGNAIKFRRPDESPRIHVGAQRQDGEWVITVRDNGIGISPQYHNRIFAIFERLHPHDKYPGTGIGLAVCRKIVERHGGRIWVESELDKGATFCFSIPV